jgi:hypothetical protein
MLLGAFLSLIAALAAGIWGLRHHGHELAYSAMVAGLWVLAAGLALQWVNSA